MQAACKCVYWDENTLGGTRRRREKRTEKRAGKSLNRRAGGAAASRSHQGARRDWGRQEHEKQSRRPLQKMKIKGAGKQHFEKTVVLAGARLSVGTAQGRLVCAPTSNSRRHLRNRTPTSLFHHRDYSSGWLCGVSNNVHILIYRIANAQMGFECHCAPSRTKRGPMQRTLATAVHATLTFI